MITFKQYKENAFQNPAADIDQYIIGLKNRLILLKPEEVEIHREKLLALKETLNRILGNE